MHPAAAQNRDPLPALQTVAILPARIGSQRLPRKMLLAETGTPLVVHAIRNVLRCPAVGRALVATDSEEIARAVRAAGFEACATSPEHPSGTDRVFEALRPLGGAFDVVLNVQADEPDVDSGDLAALIALFAGHGAFTGPGAEPRVEVATLSAPIASEEEARDPSVVKVVCDHRGDALYFSRADIPTRVHARSAARADGAPGLAASRRHVGVYAFRPAALERFCNLPRGVLEELESLEQLRWLEAGGRMRVLPARHLPRGIDTRRDYEEFVARCAARRTHSR